MDNFKNCFGIEASEVQPTVLIVPFLHRGMLEQLGIEQMHKGSPFTSGQGKNFTLIQTMIGATFVGDATLQLATTPCKQIFFIGAAGINPSQEANDFAIGSLAIIKHAYNYESFSDLLDADHQQRKSIETDITLLSEFLSTTQSTIDIVKGASFGSIYLEGQFTEELNNQDITMIDLEVCAFLKAAQKINRRALALVYATDIIGKTSPFSALSSESANKIQQAQHDALKHFLNFIKAVH